MVSLYGSDVWYSCVVQLCGPVMWYCCVVQLCGIDVLCGICPKIPHEFLCGTSMWYILCGIFYVVLLCGNPVWYLCVVMLCGKCPKKPQDFSVVYHMKFSMVFSVVDLMVYPVVTLCGIPYKIFVRAQKNVSTLFPPL